MGTRLRLTPVLIAPLAILMIVTLLLWYGYLMILPVAIVDRTLGNPTWILSEGEAGEWVELGATSDDVAVRESYPDAVESCEVSFRTRFHINQAKLCRDQHGDVSLVTEQFSSQVRRGIVVGWSIALVLLLGMVYTGCLRVISGVLQRKTTPSV